MMTSPRQPQRRPRPLAGHRSRARLSAPDAPTAPVSEPRGRIRQPDSDKGRDWGLIAATLVVVVLAACTVLVAVRARAVEQRDDARVAAQAAAEAAATAVLSYDYRRLDRDFARAQRLLTGQFAKDYAKTTDKVVRPSAEQVQAVVTADVAASAVVRTPSGDEVVVLLFVNQTTTSTRLEGPKVDLNRVRMTMREVDGVWKVADVDAL